MLWVVAWIVALFAVQMVPTEESMGTLPFGIMPLVILGVYSLDHRRPPVAGSTRPSALKHTFYTNPYLWLALGLVLVLYLSRYAGHLSPLTFRVALFVDCLAVAVLEELLFRFQLFDLIQLHLLKKGLSDPEELALATSLLVAFLFAASHLDFNPWLFSARVLVSLVAQSLRYLTKTPFAAVGYHFTHNYLIGFFV